MRLYFLTCGLSLLSTAFCSASSRDSNQSSKETNIDVFESLVTVGSSFVVRLTNVENEVLALNGLIEHDFIDLLYKIDDQLGLQFATFSKQWLTAKESSVWERLHGSLYIESIYETCNAVYERLYLLSAEWNTAMIHRGRHSLEVQTRLAATMFSGRVLDFLQLLEDLQSALSHNPSFKAKTKIIPWIDCEKRTDSPSWSSSSEVNPSTHVFDLKSYNGIFSTEFTKAMQPVLDTSFVLLITLERVGKDVLALNGLEGNDFVNLFVEIHNRIAEYWDDFIVKHNKLEGLGKCDCMYAFHCIEPLYQTHEKIYQQLYPLAREWNQAMVHRGRHAPGIQTWLEKSLVSENVSALVDVVDNLTHLLSIDRKFKAKAKARITPWERCAKRSDPPEWTPPPDFVPSKYASKPRNYNGNENGSSSPNQSVAFPSSEFKEAIQQFLVHGATFLATLEGLKDEVEAFKILKGDDVVNLAVKLHDQIIDDYSNFLQQYENAGRSVHHELVPMSFYFDSIYETCEAIYRRLHHLSAEWNKAIILHGRDALGVQNWRPVILFSENHLNLLQIIDELETTLSHHSAFKAEIRIIPWYEVVKCSDLPT